MKKIDLVKLRKSTGMSQKELASRLSVRQSFLSAIENGRSRLPAEKMSMIKEIFDIEDFTPYLIDSDEEDQSVPPHSHVGDENDSIAAILRHIHAQAHKDERNRHGSGKELQDRLEYLTHRNDRLSDRLDDLRDEVDRLREENYRLKELFTLNGIKFNP